LRAARGAPPRWGHPPRRARRRGPCLAPFEAPVPPTGVRMPPLQPSGAAPSIDPPPASGRKLPMSTFVERYVAGDIQVNGDLQAFFRRKEEVLNYRLTLEQLKFLGGGFIPSGLVHNPAADRKTVTSDYDRGHDL